MFADKRILITGGTGSLGKVLTKRLLGGEQGMPSKVIIFSRDEARQHFMRLQYLQLKNTTEETIYHNFERILEFRIGDVRNYRSVSSCLHEVDIVINAAAMKQVPTCEYFPYEAVDTNIIGANNIVQAIHEQHYKIDTVVGVSTDKACKPVNVMGMTKAVQERIFISANILSSKTKFVCVRYGNVLASRGSVIPMFHEQIQQGGPLTITTSEMTRFLMTLDHAVDTIFATIKGGEAGDIFLPKAESAKIVDVATALIEERDIELKIIGIRPGEKIHEILISEEESWRTCDLGSFYSICPSLPELRHSVSEKVNFTEFSSAGSLLSLDDVTDRLTKHGLMVGKKAYEEDMDMLC